MRPVRIPSLVLALCASSTVSGQIALTEVAGAAGLSFTTHRGAAPTEIQLGAMTQENMGHGAAVGDYDGDGDLDVYLLQGRGWPNALFRNEWSAGIDGFVEVTTNPGVELGDLGDSRVAHFVDLDDDGDLDLLVVNCQNEIETMPPSRIFRNEGDGTFTDATAGSGFSPIGYLLCGCSLADYDLDGLLDIYVTAWTYDLGSGPHPLQWAGDNRLYRNLGGLQFEDVTEQVGLAPIVSGSPTPLKQDSFTAIFTDITGNGYPDLFLAVDHREDQFYANARGHFTSVSQQVGMTHTGNDMGVCCADLDNDRDLDFYVTNITDSVPACGAGTTDFNALHIGSTSQNGMPFFQDVAFDAGVHDTFWGWGCEFVDIDNDADLDIYAVTGMDAFLSASVPACPLIDTPSVLFVNDGTTFFANETPANVLTFEDDSRGLVAFDYDRDGDQDLLVTNVQEPVRLFRNDTVQPPGEGHWLDVSVCQCRGNVHGIGVRIDVKTDDTLTQRQVLLAGESYLVGTPAEAHFGLADADTVEYVRAHWADGTATTRIDVPADGRIEIRQPRYLCDYVPDNRTDWADILLFCWGWLNDDPRTDLNGNESSYELLDLDLFMTDWAQNAWRSW